MELEEKEHQQNRSVACVTKIVFILKDVSYIYIFMN